MKIAVYKVKKESMFIYDDIISKSESCAWLLINPPQTNIHEAVVLNHIT